MNSSEAEARVLNLVLLPSEQRLEPRRQPEAACANIDEWVFEDEITTQIAQAACRRCVLRINCLKYELETPTTNAIRGGLNVEQRNQLRPAYLAHLAAESLLEVNEA